MLHRLRDLAMPLPRATPSTEGSDAQLREEKIIPCPGNDVTESSTELTACYRRDKSIFRARSNFRGIISSETSLEYGLNYGLQVLTENIENNYKFQARQAQ